jgi:hypothetical protein
MPSEDVKRNELVQDHIKSQVLKNHMLKVNTKFKTLKITVLKSTNLKGV